MPTTASGLVDCIHRGICVVGVDFQKHVLCCKACLSY